LYKRGGESEGSGKEQKRTHGWNFPGTSCLESQQKRGAASDDGNPKDRMSESSKQELDDRLKDRSPRKYQCDISGAIV
jgi:hypothetical protein